VNSVLECMKAGVLLCLLVMPAAYCSCHRVIDSLRCVCNRYTVTDIMPRMCYVSKVRTEMEFAVCILPIFKTL